ncbi:MAG: DMT family transporter [Firmicutes bacterium]|nr:DMT family transporter [Bacillota bacterium]
MRPPAARQALLADLALAGVTLIWGATFVVIKAALATVTPFAFLAARFLLAAAVLLLLARRGLGRLGRREWTGSLLAGLFLFAGYAAQTIGLQQASPAKAGFLTGLSVVLVPLLAPLAGGRPRPATWLGVALATAGLLVLTLPPGASWNELGRLQAADLWLLACAFAFALQILSVGRLASSVPAEALTAVQMLAVALLSLAAWAFLEAPRHPLAATWPALVRATPALLMTGLLASALAYWVQSRAQAFTTPTHAALLFTLEPVWSYLFAVLWAGERLAARPGAGGLLILAGMLWTEWSGSRAGGASSHPAGARSQPASRKRAWTPDPGAE